jgi:acid stress-induced BolA-like protein IbaG/YrbA
VISEDFAGQRPIARHQRIYSALGARVGREIHALSIEAHTAEEWAARRGG